MKKLLTLTSVAAVSMSTLLGSGITTFANAEEREVVHDVETDSTITFIPNEGGTIVVPPPGDGDKDTEVDINPINPDFTGQLSRHLVPASLWSRNCVSKY